MSQEVRTRTAESGTRQSLDGLDDLDGGPSVSASDALARLWRFFISMRTGLVLILALGLLSLIGTLLVQVPAGLATDPAAYTSWLTSIHSKYGVASNRAALAPCRLPRLQPKGLGRNRHRRVRCGIKSMDRPIRMGTDLALVTW